MVKKCPKCGYERQQDEKTPSYECPSCGIVYAKYEKKLNQQKTPKNVPPMKEPDINPPQSTKKISQPKRSMKKIAWTIGLVLVVVIGYVAAGPYLTISQIKTGIVEQDSEKLSDNIDFPALRQNLKDQLNAVMMKKAATKLKDNPFAALAAGFATKMVDGIVDSFVTPTGLASIMEGKKPSRSGTGDTKKTNPPKKEDLFKNARFSYDSMSKFSIWVPNDKGQEVRFVLKRDGFSWKLVNLIVPMDEKS